MTGQIVSNPNTAPVMVPEDVLTVYPVPVGAGVGGENLLKRSAMIAQERGVEEAEQFFLKEFDTLYDDASLFINEWDNRITEESKDSVLHLAGLVYSGDAIEVEELIESGIPKTFNHLYLLARYYETQGCIPALQRTMHTLQCIKETALDQNDSQFNKYVFRRALCDDWYFGENGFSAMRDLFLDNPDSEILLDNLRRMAFTRVLDLQPQNTLALAFLNHDCSEEQFRQLCNLTRIVDITQWEIFIEFLKEI